jgi:hypothetical protein
MTIRWSSLFLKEDLFKNKLYDINIYYLITQRDILKTGYVSRRHIFEKEKRKEV